MDLGVALAIASALRDRPVEEGDCLLRRGWAHGGRAVRLRGAAEGAELLKLGLERIIKPRRFARFIRGAHKMTVRKTERPRGGRGKDARGGCSGGSPVSPGRRHLRTERSLSPRARGPRHGACGRP